MSKCTATVTEPRRWEGQHSHSCGAAATWFGEVDGAHTARCDVHRPGGADDQRREERSRLRLVIATVLVGLGAWLFIRFARGW